ncbi:MAG: ankyrin repeat domain-containing protein [Ruminococcus sp.]|nr:ankyrin repeat domain-containing protein [Ruminococcus sp.]
MDRLNRDELFYLIADEKEDEALKALAKCDNLDFQDKNGYSYLHIAAQSGLAKVVEYLLSNGASIDITDKFGKTPLMVAISGYNGDRTIVDIFLKYGADLDLAVPSGITDKKLAVMKGLSL